MKGWARKAFKGEGWGQKRMEEGEFWLEEDERLWLQGGGADGEHGLKRDEGRKNTESDKEKR